MARPPMAAEASGRVVVDLSATQSPSSRARGIGRYALNWALALEAHHPEMVCWYHLDETLPPPGPLGELLGTGKVGYGVPDRGRRGGVYHVLSPFDLDLSVEALWPQAAWVNRWPLSVTVYDLIPAHNEAAELADPLRRRQYLTRLELVRGADMVQVLSRSVAADLGETLALPQRRIRLVGAASAPMFLPPESRDEAHARALHLLGVAGTSPTYVLYPSGSHPRKNNETLIIAFALLAEQVRANRRLVIAGDLDGATRQHFAHLAATLGIGGAVLAPGYLSDADLVLLHQGAELVCVPSLAEGYGLPVVEALACDTPVIASDRPPFDELLGPEARFDPSEPAAIAATLTKALTDAPLRARLMVQPGRARNWKEVADASAAAFSELIDRHDRRRGRPSGRRRRPRLAFVSPLPPAPTGVAAYSYRLVEELCNTEKLDVEVFVDGPALGQLAPFELPVHHVDALRPVEAFTGRFDHVVYTLGNSHHHLGALRSLRRRRGVVLAHDVRLSNLYRHETGDPGFLPGGLARAIGEMYAGGLPPATGIEGALTRGEIDRYGVLMAREAIACSELFLVNCEEAAALARVEAGAPAAGRVAVLPFAFEAGWRRPLPFEERRVPPGEALGALAARWGGPPPGPGVGPLIAHFGIVDPSKAPELLLRTFSLLAPRHPDARLAFVGPVSDAMARRLASLAAALGVEERLTLTGPLGSEAYGAWLRRATLAVQLRTGFNGEASAALGECLASGVATVVSRLGFFAGLPDEAVEKVAPGVSANELCGVLTALLDDAPRRAALAAAGEAEAARRSFSRSARALVAVLEQQREVREAG